MPFIFKILSSLYTSELYFQGWGMGRIQGVADGGGMHVNLKMVDNMPSYFTYDIQKMQYINEKTTLMPF